MTPKFRAWDKVAEDIFIPEVLELDKYGKVTGIFSKGTMFSIEDFELLQSTRLKDINGKEIYEGDILKVEYGDLLGETRETLIIAKNPFEYSMEEAKFLDFSYIVEIIGNKFEHPHLLEED